MSSTTLIALSLMVLVLVVLPITVAVYRAWKVPRAWDALQRKRGLDDDSDKTLAGPTPNHLSGDIRGKEVEVWMDTDIAAGNKSGPPHAHYTNIEVPLNTDDDSRVGIKLKGVGTTIWRKVMTSPGGYRYKADEMDDGGESDVDAESFDDRFAIAGRLSDPLREALSSTELADVLDELLSSSAELHIENGTLLYTEPGRVSREGRLKLLVDDIVEVALLIDEALDD